MTKVNMQSSEFVAFRDGQTVYVDKTAYLQRLVNSASDSHLFFLARPRRFGKSLMISTLKAIFQGRRDLFEGLSIAQCDYNWQAYPVIHLDLSMATGESLEAFRSGLKTLVQAAFDIAGLPYQGETPRDALLAVLGQLAKQQQQAVVLIDEYDAPICHTLHCPELCNQIRAELGSFYSVMKGYQRAIRFAMLTGISKFASLAVFSGLNMLVDLTYDPAFATMLGYTEAELSAYFSAHLERRAREMGLSLADFRAGLARWFNGYRFAPGTAETVYNPVAIARTLNSSAAYFEAQWTTTGRTSLLANFLRRDELLELDFDKPIEASPAELETPSQLEALDPVAVLYQAGYLTIADYDPAACRYTLRVPDEEIRSDLHAFLGELSLPDAPLRARIRRDVGVAHLDRFLRADLPDLYAQCHYGATEVRIQEYNYQRLLQVFFLALGGNTLVEVTQSSGARADLVAKVHNLIYIFEFKCDGSSAEEALAQIRARGYATPYLHDGRPIALVGLAFHKGKRELQGVAYELLPAPDAAPSLRARQAEAAPAQPPR